MRRLFFKRKGQFIKKEVKLVMRQDKKLSNPLINIENLNINIQVNIDSEGSQKITSSRNARARKEKSCFWTRLKKMLAKFMTKIDVNIIIILSELIFTLFK